MCRLVTFSGRCIRCGNPYTVSELEQSISCLEAKNNGGFGHCRRGVLYDHHDPAFECGPCASAMGIAEGSGGDGDDLLVAATTATVTHHSSSRSSKSNSGGGGSGSHDTSKRRRVR